MSTRAPEASDFIYPLTINKLHGRIMRLPRRPGQTREMLFIAGQHSSLERWWGLAQAFNEFAGVTMPDLPGFGGMDSLYSAGKTADIDTLADHLAVFIKKEYGSKRITVAGMSLSFVIVTRMLQRHPALTKQIDVLISIVGLAHHTDFIFHPLRKIGYKYASWFFSGRFTSAFFRATFLQPAYLRRAYSHSLNAKEKFKELSGDEFKRTMDTELHLWNINDIRTQMKTNHQMLTLDNTGKTVPLPVWHVAAPKDRYFDNKQVEKHLRQVFNDVHMTFTKASNHAPTVIADVEAAAPFIPDDLRAILLKQPKH